MSLLDDFAMMLSKQDFLESRAEFYEDMAIDFENGGQEKTFLAKRAMRYTKNKLPGARVIALIANTTQHVKGGFPEAAKGILPENERIILATGWQSNQFVQALREASNMQGAMDEIKKDIKSAVLALSGSMLLSAVLLIGWLIKLAPAFEFKGRYPLSAWSKPSQFTYSVASGLYDYGLYIVALIALLVVAFLWAKSNWTYESKFGHFRKTLDNQMPFVFVRDMNASAFLTSLASMLATGMQVRTALETMLKSANPYMRVIINQMIVRLGTQKGLGDALNVGLFNLQTSFRIEDFTERNANVSDAIRKIAVITLNRMRQSVSKALSKISLAGKYIFAFAIVVFMVGTLLTPMQGKEYINQHMYDNRH